MSSMYSSYSSPKSSVYSGTPASVYSYDSWGTVPTLSPSSPGYSTPAPSYHTLPSPHGPKRSQHVNPLLHRSFDLRAPPPAPPSHAPATSMQTTRMALQLTSAPFIQPYTTFLDSPNGGPISVSALLDFLYKTLHTKMHHSELAVLRPEEHAAVVQAYERRLARTGGDRNSEGYRVGDRLGGGWVVNAVYPSMERGVWTVEMGMP
ncbi:hypothetical protein H0H87_009284 [Tephrocybe sp. NHM501043]|nr:hypothetical protein H0H87_009284 [Tephrocybe sp. NHM501043]